MNWLPALAVGIVTASFGTILGFLGGDVVARAHGIASSPAGLNVFFAFVGLGLLVGLVAGVAFTRSSGARDLTGMIKQASMALLVTSGIMGVITGIGYLLS